MSDASLKFCARLRTIYGDPISESVDEFMFEYARILGKYNAAVLDAACDLVMTRHKGPHRWPRIGDCVDACEDTIATEAAAQRRREVSKDPYPEWAPAAMAKADKLIQCDLGRRAAREGWITPLWDYCRRAGELPGPGLIPRLKADSDRFNEAYGKTRENTPLRALGDSMLARRDRLSAITDPAGRDA